MPTKYDPTTGEAHDEAHASASPDDDAKGPRWPRPARRRSGQTPEEQTVAGEVARYRSAVAMALESVSPALEAEVDPPLRAEGPMPAAQVTPLLELPRLSTSGAPGAALVASVREGDSGPYLLVHVEFHASGYRFRTRGAAIRREEARDVDRVLLEWANRVGAP